MVVVAEPVRLVLETTGQMDGASAGYDQRLGDMAGVYRDDDAYQEQVQRRGADQLVYTVQEHRTVDDDGALIIGTSTLLPGRIGEEFAVTRGHLHARANRAELYYCLSGRGVMLLETLDGRGKTVELTAGQAAHVPGHWVHRSVNVGDVPFVTMFCYPADAGQDYTLIAQAGGMATLVVADAADRWRVRPNPHYTGYLSRTGPFPSRVIGDSLC